MKNSRLLFGIVIIVFVLLGVAFFLRKNPSLATERYAETNRLLPATTTPDIAKRFTDCKSLPNGSTQEVKEKARMYVNLPKDLYPNVNIAVNSDGATATDASTGGQYGHAEGGTPGNCWSYYLEFDGEGRVDLISKSGTTGVPDYVLHFQVTKS
jgi:hypothetical protein